MVIYNRVKIDLPNEYSNLYSGGKTGLNHLAEVTRNFTPYSIVQLCSLFMIDTLLSTKSQLSPAL